MISSLSSLAPSLTTGVAKNTPAVPAVRSGEISSGDQSSSAPVSSATQAPAEWDGGYGQSLGKSPFSGASPEASTGSLTPEQQRQLEKLKETDRKVRAHEQAHVAAGGNLVQGGASFSYEKGPDGQMYAVAGEVSIDTSPGRTPAETLAKASQIRAAAMAPADPSPQDRRVALGAAQLEATARAEQAKEEAAALPEEGSAASAFASESSGGGAVEAFYRAAEVKDTSPLSRINLFV